MSLALLAESLVSSGVHYSLDVKNLRDLSAKMCVLSFKYIDRKALWDRVCPGAYVHWDIVKPDTNTLGDLLVWIPLLELFSWEGVERHEAAHPPLVNMRKAMRAAGIDFGGSGLLCQLLILHMLQGIPSLQAFQLMTCRLLKRDTSQACALLLAALSDCPQTPEAYELALAVALGECLRVDTAPLEAHLRSAQARKQDISRALKQKSMTSYSGRPRLRDRATPSAEQKLRLDTAHGTWESYTGFCQLHQFPNALSESVKARLYFLASQEQWDWRQHVPAILRHGGEVAEKVRQFPVSRPDLGVLHQVNSFYFLFFLSDFIHRELEIIETPNQRPQDRVHVHAVLPSHFSIPVDILVLDSSGFYLTLSVSVQILVSCRLFDFRVRMIPEELVIVVFCVRSLPVHLHPMYSCKLSFWPF